MGAGLRLALLAGLVLPHDGVLRHYHARAAKKTNTRKKANRKATQAARRRNRHK